MSTGLSPCACMALRNAARAVSRFYDDALAPTGLTITQFSLLRNIARLGDAPLSRLADALFMDRTSLYRTLQPMVREGWIAIGSGKGRSKIATLTAAGETRIADATASWEAAQTRFIRRFGTKAWRDVSLGLQKAITIADII